MLQHASWQRCCSSRHCGTVAAGAAALLQQALRQRCGVALARVAAVLWRCCCGAVAARSNDGKQRTMQRWQVALVLAATAGRATLLCSDGRWPTPKFLFFFYSTVSKRERRARQGEKRQGFETCFPALLVGKLLPVNSLLQRQLPLAAAATSTLRRQQHTNTLR